MNCPMKKRVVYEHDGRDHMTGYTESFMECEKYECEWFTVKGMCSARHFAEFEPIEHEVDIKDIVKPDDEWNETDKDIEGPEAFKELAAKHDWMKVGKGYQCPDCSKDLRSKKAKLNDRFGLDDKSRPKKD